MKKITVLIADDHTVVVHGLKALLSAERDLEVVGTAETGLQAVQLARKLLPDVIVMDIAMPLLNGLEAARQITKEIPSIRVLILTCYCDEEYVRQLIETGAAGYIIKQSPPYRLTQAIREVHKGNMFLNPGVWEWMTDCYRDLILGVKPERRKGERITSRELEVLQLIAEGKKNKAIAAELCISIETVRRHRQNLMHKLDIHDIAGLTRYALSKGIIEIGAGVKAL